MLDEQVAISMPFQHNEVWPPGASDVRLMPPVTRTPPETASRAIGLGLVPIPTSPLTSALILGALLLVVTSCQTPAPLTYCEKPTGEFVVFIRSIRGAPTSANPP